MSIWSFAAAALLAGGGLSLGSIEVDADPRARHRSRGGPKKKPPADEKENAKRKAARAARKRTKR